MYEGWAEPPDTDYFFFELFVFFLGLVLCLYLSGMGALFFGVFWGFL